MLSLLNFSLVWFFECRCRYWFLSRFIDILVFYLLDPRSKNISNTKIDFFFIIQLQFSCQNDNHEHNFIWIAWNSYINVNINENAISISFLKLNTTMNKLQFVIFTQRTKKNMSLILLYVYYTVASLKKNCYHILSW